MRFKTGLCLKLCLGAATLLGCSLLFLKENDGTDFSATAAGPRAGAGADTEQRRNETKPPPGEVAEGGGGGGEGDMVDPSDSLAGSRIEGLPNVTESRKEKFSYSEKDFDSVSVNILENIYKANKDQKIYNEDLLGPVTNKTVVIAIQVHDRIQYLRHLIKSFSLAKGIEHTLLVFSHDVWDENINYLVRSIDFCMTMQIFYPFSLQTHKHRFPGKSQQDCPRDIKKEKALASSCINAEWPDTHGHYREAQFTQTKHHWWWKANWIFGKIPTIQYFTGLVLFLEEDHYVAEDFLHVLALMEAEKLRAKYKADILSLGTYLRRTNNIRANGRQPSRYAKGRKNPPQNYAFRQILWQPSFLTSVVGAYKQAEVAEWVSSKHNMGMALTRSQWAAILACTNKFCKFDDYNWDWSLQHISHHCLQNKLQVIMAKGPRVFHIGDCGVHHKKANCDSNTGLEKVKSIIKSAKNYLFPPSLQYTVTGLRKKLKEKKPNGGWGDHRDHQLCINFTLAGP